MQKKEKTEQDRVTKDKTKISDYLKKTEYTMSQAKHFIQSSTTADLLMAKAFVSKLLQKLPAPELSAFTEANEKATLFHTVFCENKALRDTVQNAAIGVLDKTATKGNQCTVEDLNEATAGLEIRFKLITRNAEGKQSYSPGDHVVVQLASSEDGTLAGEIKIVSENNGSYEVSCIPKREGKHKVTACVNGEQVGHLTTFHVTKRCYKLVQTIGKKGTGAGELSLPWGIAVNDKNEIFISDKEGDRLQVFNEKGNFIKTVKHELLSSPSGICTDSAGRIYVAAMNRVLLINPNGDYMKVISDNENQGWGGITLDEEENIIVCKGGVHILSPEGQLLKTLKRDYFVPFDCVLYGRKIFVSNWATDAVDVFDCEGKFLKEIGKHGSGSGSFRQPTGLAIDKTGLLVVADENGVQIFTPDGMFVTKFGDDIVSDPYGVSVLRDGRIIVTDGYKGRLFIFA